MKLCSKNFVSSYNTEMKKTDLNNEFQETHYLATGKKPGMKTPASGLNQPTSSQMVVYARDDTCTTCLTSLTPATCHKKGRCLSSSSSFNLNNHIPASSVDNAAEKRISTAKDFKHEKSESNASDAKFVTSVEIPLKNGEQAEQFLLKESNNFASNDNGQLFPLGDDEKLKKGRNNNSILVKNMEQQDVNTTKC